MRVKLQDAAAKLEELLAQAQASGEGISIQRDGKPDLIVHVTSSAQITDSPQRRAEETPAWKFAIDLGNTVSEEELNALPSDYSRNLDHYLYGHSKRED